MIRCGQLCRSCAGGCRNIVSEADPVEIECPRCGGIGCEDCEDGSFTLRSCPSEWIGHELRQAVNMAGLCGAGVMPAQGGLLDQAAWFLDLYTTLKAETSRIDAERMRSME